MSLPYRVLSPSVEGENGKNRETLLAETMCLSDAVTVASRQKKARIVYLRATIWQSGEDLATARERSFAALDKRLAHVRVAVG